MLKYANIIGTILILFGLILPVSAQEKFFKNRLILPPLQGFEVFAQTMDDNAAERVKKSSERWSVDDASKSLDAFNQRIVRGIDNAISREKTAKNE